MDNCERWREAISAYADGECSPTERKAVEVHLQECPDCCRWLEQITADQQLFTQSLMGRQADISDSVMRRVSEMSAEKTTPVKARKPSPTRRLVELLAVVGVMAVLAAVFFPVFSRARDKARQTSCLPNIKQLVLSGSAREKARVTTCLSNIKQLTLAMMMFAEDYDGRLPNSLTWADDIYPYVNNDELFRCPDDESAQKVSYAMVRRWSEAILKDIPEPANTILIYEVDEQGMPAMRHNGGMNVGFADGHAKWINELPPDVTGTTGIMPGASDRNYGLRRQLQIAYGAACEVWVSDIQEAVVAAEEIFHWHGGFVLNSTLRQTPGPMSDRSAQITGKVPTAEVGSTINALAALGYVAYREIQGQDLTDQYVQTAREITQATDAMQKLQQRRPRARQAERKQIDEQLKATRQELGQAQDKHFGVQRELALATVSVTLVEKSPKAAGPSTGLLAAWRSFVRAVVKVGVALAWVALYGLFLVPIIVGVIIYRRRRSLP